MQEFRIRFTTARSRRTSEEKLRDQLNFIGRRALQGNRGRGWSHDVGSIVVEESASGDKQWTIQSHIRFYRQVDTALEKFEKQATEVSEWALATGHAPQFAGRYWIGTSEFSTTSITPVEEEKSIVERDYTTLASVGVIGKGTYYDHLYNLEPQIEVLLSSVQAAIDSGMENRFHTLLHGFPGCGKTDILLSTSRLLDDLGVSFLSLDATSTTEAGLRKILLDESNDPPDVIFFEEIEKVKEESLRPLLGIMDDRGIIQQANYRLVASREVKTLVLATANDYDLFKSMMRGALLSRFNNEIYCPRPNRETLYKFLQREVSKLENGKVEWIEPTLQFCYDDHGMTDPRQLKRVCLCGKDELVNGEYQKYLVKTMRLEQVSPTVSDVSDL